MKYSPEPREAILRKLLPPNNRPVTEVAEEEGISDATLYNWRNEARKNGQLLPDHGSDPEGCPLRAARATLDLNDALYCLRFLLMILLLVEMMNQSLGTCPNFGVHFR